MIPFTVTYTHPELGPRRDDFRNMRAANLHADYVNDILRLTCTVSPTDCV